MSKNREFVIFVIFISLLFIALFYSISINNKRIQMKSDLENYLFDVKNYEETDIKELHISYQWFKGGEYHGIVVFKDDPSSKYIYAYNNKEIYQQGGSGLGKHFE